MSLSTPPVGSFRSIASGRLPELDYVHFVMPALAPASQNGHSQRHGLYPRSSNAQAKITLAQPSRIGIERHFAKPPVSTFVFRSGARAGAHVRRGAQGPA